jgi:hypothetical protein
MIFSRSTYALVFLVLSGIGVARIVFTYPVFNHTFDEPAHITGGLEWLDEGTYTREVLHPPLPRVLVALGPYLDGARYLDATGAPAPEGKVLYEGDRYWRRLTLGRVGVLLFYLLAAWVVWTWAREAYGVSAAIAALAFLSTLPPILAHSGLATTDMALAAVLTAALHAFGRWVQVPSAGNGSRLGFLLGLALLAKMSAFVFLPAAGVALLVARWWLGSEGRGREPRVKSALIAIAVTFLVVWIGYRFSVGALAATENRPHDPVDRVVDAVGGSEAVRTALYEVVEAPIFPAPELVRGLNAARAKNASGHAGYVLGRRLEDRGTWIFFPVALAVKTPLPFLLLAGVGGIIALRTATRTRDWRRVGPLFAAGAVLLASLPTNINLGVRHVLPVYLLLSPVAALAAVTLFRLRWWGAVLGTGLLLWHFGASARAHPDYLAYFNILASRHPETVLVDSDLDWGQDLHRLSQELETLEVTDLAIAYFGTADLEAAGLPPRRRLDPFTRTSGWVAASRTLLALEPGYAWLREQAPEKVVGRSIELYFLPPGEPPGP